MPLVNLYPSNTIGSPSGDDWVIIGGFSTIHESLADDGGTGTGAECTTADAYIEVELDNLDSAGLNIATITSIQATMEANIDERSQTSLLRCDYRDSSGNVINSYTDNLGIATTGTNTEYTWTARTTSNGSDAWIDSDIDGMRLRILLRTDSSVGNTEVFHLYLTVTYTEIPPQSTYTSDDQVTLSGGTLEFKNGMTIIGSKN